jgi:GT2 family glycosyltransferase
MLLSTNGRIQTVGAVFDGFSFKSKGFNEIDKGQYDSTEFSPEATAGGTLYSKKMMKKIGLFDEIYSPFLAEDEDYSFRMRAAGFKILFCGSSKIIHKGGVDIGKINNIYRFFINSRNNLILHFRYYPISFNIMELLKVFTRCSFTTLYSESSNTKKFTFHNDFLHRYFTFLKAFRHALILYKIKKVSFIDRN